MCWCVSLLVLVLACLLVNGGVGVCVFLLLVSVCVLCIRVGVCVDVLCWCLN